jgi:hypothetical protein
VEAASEQTNEIVGHLGRCGAKCRHVRVIREETQVVTGTGRDLIEPPPAIATACSAIHHPFLDAGLDSKGNTCPYVPKDAKLIPEHPSQGATKSLPADDRFAERVDRLPTVVVPL